MAVWNRLRAELDRAGRAAQQALDEGKIRLDIHRARSAADKCAQRLGYAVHRARMSGVELPAEEYARLSSDLTAAEGEVAGLTALLEQAELRRSGKKEPADAPAGGEAPPG
jgi:regulator of protease activity HflC (stomatin/prohibitin superfamily)